MMRRFILLNMFIAMSLLVACHDQPTTIKSHKEIIVTAKLKKPVEKLYFSGILKPITMNSILSSVAGRVTKIYFSYGQSVKKGQPLLAIDSKELTDGFRKSIADYLQKKSVYSNSQEEFRGSQALYKAGVISREEFLNSRNQYRSNQLNYYQSQYDMEKILVKVGVNPKDIEKLSLEDSAQISEILKRQFKHIIVKANADGIVLFPINSGNHGDGDNSQKKIELGSEVKQGQLLLTIGDLHGLSTEIYVNEINVNRIHKGMKAVVTGSAFPGITLEADVASVSSQAKETQSNSSSSEFPVLIDVPSLTDKQREVIHVGMSAKVALAIHPDASILLPINAVYMKNDHPMVTLVTKLGGRKSVPVIIGFTTPTQVSIVSGLKPGNKVAYTEDEA